MASPAWYAGIAMHGPAGWLFSQVQPPCLLGFEPHMLQTMPQMLLLKLHAPLWIPQCRILQDKIQASQTSICAYIALETFQQNDGICVRPVEAGPVCIWSVSHLHLLQLAHDLCL